MGMSLDQEEDRFLLIDKQEYWPDEDDGRLPRRPSIMKFQQSRFYTGLKLLACILFVSATGALMTIVSLQSHTRCQCQSEPQCGLATDSLFGEIPWRTVILEEDPEFVASDPGLFETANAHTIWNDIYSSSWVAVSDPSQVGFGGGVQMREYAQNPSDFDDKSEAFGVGVMHQIHCMAIIKHSVLQYRASGTTTQRDSHLDHCMEYLRQVVMCHGDLTLERPINTSSYPQGFTGWGNARRCRDWRLLIDSIKEHNIERGPTGWLKLAAD